ncbi:MAG: hypothetical protein ACWA41_03030 [Putridiphycobacter sp.]
MLKIHLSLSLLTSILILSSCQQKNISQPTKVATETNLKYTVQEKPTHNYGGWYCPDNLNGFPPVNLEDWKTVPVVKDRMPTKEETQNGTSLIFVDQEKHPDAEPLDIQLPALARYYCHSSQKEELVIIIQAFQIDQDSIVGFRYLNGGNGSSYLHEVSFVGENDSTLPTTSKFISEKITIKSNQEKVWEILTSPMYTKKLQPIFDPKGQLETGWENQSKVNYKLLTNSKTTAEYADQLFGNYYIQLDYLVEGQPYVEKFLLLQNPEKTETELKVVIGPHQNDYNSQHKIIKSWMEKVKVLSEVD